MKEKKLKILYLILFIIGLTGFVVHIFILETPDGNLGFILGLIEVLLIIISTIRLCQLSKSLKNNLFKFLDVIFRGV